MSDYPWQTDTLIEKGLRPYPSLIETRRNLMTERRPQMSTFVRCSSGNTGPAWTCVLPAGHDGDHIYSLWSEIATMAEAEIRLHEAAIQRVRNIQQRYVSVSRDEMSQTDALGAIGRALDGERDE